MIILYFSQHLEDLLCEYPQNLLCEHIRRMQNVAASPLAAAAHCAAACSGGVFAKKMIAKEIFLVFAKIIFPVFGKKNFQVSGQMIK